jgi:hypothetical protein
MKRFFLALLVMVTVCLVMFTCRYLPYDEKILYAMGTIEKLTLESTIGPFQIDNLCFYPDSERLTFIPDKEINTSGFLIKSRSDGSVEFRYVQQNETTLIVTPSLTMFVSMNHPLKPNGYAETITGSPGRLFYITYDYDYHPEMTPEPSPSPSPRCGVISYDGSTNISKIGENDLIMSIQSAVQAVTINGAFISPFDNRLYILATDMSWNYREVNCNIDQNGSLNGVVSTRSAGDVPKNAQPILYDMFYNYNISSRWSVISFLTENGIRNESWGDNQLTTSKFPVQGEVFGRTLSNGNLLGFEKNACTGYDFKGNRLYRFPTGDLRFVYERKDPETGEYRMIFTFIMVESYHNSCNQTLTIYVYSQPTSKVDRLNF